ncbi:MAG: WXG100 family type VII secretion target [Planctomycetota bacterium]|nr:WXG100 family type VII secretion target [Planctomycetota bacterium]
MAKAVIDPVELRRFAQDLRKFNTDVQGGMQLITARMGTLAQTWRDQEQAKFSEEFETTVKVLQRFVKASEIHIPFLLRKADRIDEYLQQR